MEKNSTSEKRLVGRPKGEASTVVNVRVPLSLLQRLDRYVDKIEVQTSSSTNRGTIMRSALKAFLQSKNF